MPRDTSRHLFGIGKSGDTTAGPRASLSTAMQNALSDAELGKNLSLVPNLDPLSGVRSLLDGLLPVGHAVRLSYDERLCYALHNSPSQPIELDHANLDSPTHVEESPTLHVYAQIRSRNSRCLLELLTPQRTAHSDDNAIVDHANTDFSSKQGLSLQDIWAPVIDQFALLVSDHENAHVNALENAVQGIDPGVPSKFADSLGSIVRLNAFGVCSFTTVEAGRTIRIAHENETYGFLQLSPEPSGQSYREPTSEQSFEDVYGEYEQRILKLAAAFLGRAIYAYGLRRKTEAKLLDVRGVIRASAHDRRSLLQAAVKTGNGHHAQELLRRQIDWDAFTDSTLSPSSARRGADAGSLCSVTQFFQEHVRPSGPVKVSVKLLQERLVVSVPVAVGVAKAAFESIMVNVVRNAKEATEFAWSFELGPDAVEFSFGPLQGSLAPEHKAAWEQSAKGVDASKASLGLREIRRAVSWLRGTSDLQAEYLNEVGLSDTACYHFRLPIHNPQVIVGFKGLFGVALGEWHEATDAESATVAIIRPGTAFMHAPLLCREKEMPLLSPCEEAEEMVKQMLTERGMKVAVRCRASGGEQAVSVSESVRAFSEESTSGALEFCRGGILLYHEKRDVPIGRDWLEAVNLDGEGASFKDVSETDEMRSVEFFVFVARAASSVLVVDDTLWRHASALNDAPSLLRVYQESVDLASVQGEFDVAIIHRAVAKEFIASNISARRYVILSGAPKGAGPLNTVEDEEAWVQKKGQAPRVVHRSAIKFDDCDQRGQFKVALLAGCCL